MLRAFDIEAAGTWNASRRLTSVSLDFDRRCRRRIALEAADGTAFLRVLRQPRHLRDGDGIALETGGIVEVKAAAEPLLDIRCVDHAQLVRVAWHLGNRHIPTELRTDSLRIRADHVLADMARGLGATVTAIDAAFDPESGAYAKVSLAHGHDHGHHHHHHDGDAA
jgi:urease accessory protein